MATTNLTLKGKNIYLRFINGRAINLNIPINISVDPKHWDKKQQKIRNVIAVKNRDEINRKLAYLKIYVLDEFNLSYINGDIIDKFWLQNIVSNFFNRPINEVNNKNENHNVYYTDFAYWWLKEIAPTRLVGSNKYMTVTEISKYKTFVDMVSEFEGKNKLKIIDVDNKKITEFVEYLVNDSYSTETIKRHVSRFKFFCARADEERIKVNTSYKKLVFVPKSEVIKAPYLNEEEIQMIYDYDFSYSKSLDNVRDNLIISVWTGLRISDFMNSLNLDNFIDEYIILTTKKTQTKVTIPVHIMVRDILIKRKGQLPNKISEAKYNKYIKIVCEKVGLTQKIQGRIYDKDKKRKVNGIFAKYKLITSHIGRRSFATNLFGKVDDSVIMSVAGWANKEMLYNYIKTTNTEYADKLKGFWQNNLKTT